MTPTSLASEQGAQIPPSESRGTVLDLLVRLADSLESSQQALLHGDASALDQATSTQAVIEAELRTALPWCSDGSAVPAVRGSLSAAESLQAQRVLFRGRVQRGLLTRAQHSLLILSNRLAQGEVTYNPVSRRSGLSEAGAAKECRCRV
ncbi:MAG TPA: hypothetical protein VMG31_12905 [Verrucomicrobiae bacterium]|nr:hypothetical protein [Verrucomicrobiae bacterium]